MCQALQGTYKTYLENVPETGKHNTDFECPSVKFKVLTTLH